MNAFIFVYSKLPTVLCQNLYRMEPVISLAESTAFWSLWIIDRPPLKNVSIPNRKLFLLLLLTRLVVPVIRSGKGRLGLFVHFHSPFLVLESVGLGDRLGSLSGILLLCLF